MPFFRSWTPCLLLLLVLTLASGGVCAEEISEPDVDAILERYLQSAAIDSAAALRELEAAADFYRQSSEASRHAQGLVLLGMAYDAGRRHSEAIKAYQEAQQALAALGDPTRAHRRQLRAVSPTARRPCSSPRRRTSDNREPRDRGTAAQQRRWTSP
jgi:hypothetical protein